MPLSKHPAAKDIQRTFAALYLKVAHEGDIRIDLPEQKDAVALRAQLYSFATGQRKLAERCKTGASQEFPPSEELLDALGAVMFRIEGSTLFIEARIRKAGMAKLLEALGGAATVAQTAATALPGENDFAGMFERLQDAARPAHPSAAPEASSANPYYDRTKGE